jgi:hypothetical protein
MIRHHATIRAPVFSPRCPYLKIVIAQTDNRVGNMPQKVKNQVIETLYINQPLSAKQLFEATNHYSFNGFRNALNGLVMLGYVHRNRKHHPTIFSLTAYGEAHIMANAGLQGEQLLGV